MKVKLIGIFIGIILVGTVLSVSGNVNVNKNSYLSINGNTLYVGGFGEGNYSKIQDAIDDSLEGNTVFVYNDSSPYFENLIVDKSINLIGEDKNSTVIRDYIGIFSDDVEISEFSIENITTPGTSSGIYVSNCSDVIVSDNIIQLNFRGINMRESKNCKIINNNVNSNSLGLTIFSSSDIVIESNYIFDNFFVDGYGGTGIGLGKSENVVILTNIIDNNRYGIEYEPFSTNNIIYNNIISNNSIKGVSLLSLSCSNNQIIENSFLNNNNAIFLDESCNNIIKSNNFIGNKIPAIFDYYTLFNNNNQWVNNYWERPRIFPKLILGKMRYENLLLLHLPWFNIDWHPALEPYDIEV